MPSVCYVLVWKDVVKAGDLSRQGHLYQSVGGELCDPSATADKDCTDFVNKKILIDTLLVLHELSR